MSLVVLDVFDYKDYYCSDVNGCILYTERKVCPYVYLTDVSNGGLSSCTSFIK